ncbi:MAG: S8/S53 family peptidase [Candidatus Hatepunaea meridiana]|nr:S8/S53 family peptidase [Candidatus Hatepunaea meridiana]
MLKNNYIWSIYIIFQFLAVASQAGTGEGPDEKITPVQTDRYWVFLEREHKSAVELDRDLDEAAKSLSARSLTRRHKVIAREPSVRQCDLPISRSQIEAIEATGCRVVRQLRYINAVTVTGLPYALNAVRRLGFVSEVRPVMAYHSLNNVHSSARKQHDQIITDNDELFGRALDQSLMVNVPAAHDAGYRGQGVLIGVQDTGFDNLDHRGFRYMEIVDAYDFLNGDDNVADEGDHGSGRHGTRTLSVIAALDSGSFIGVAPQAQFVLTKTENSESETPVEEDIWIEGLWFHDSLGVDVLSSSLSYRAWYDWEDMDGRTAVTTRAADSAAAAGIVIVNSMGNTGLSDYPDSKMGAPADARMVISVGGVRSNGEYWAVSSQGPTYDRRIKPDVVARGASVYTASNLNDTAYFSHSGTSFSCPIIAGIAALIVQAHPYLSPAEVIDILHQTASMADEPDTLRGYGIPDALAAVEEAASRQVADNVNIPQIFNFNVYPNPFNGRLNLQFMGDRMPRTVQVFDISGRRLNIPEILDKNIYNGLITVDFDGRASGVYVVKVYNGDFMFTKRVVYIR